MRQRGELFILSAPSGTGKTTLIQGMMRGALAGFGGLVFSVSHTTRRQRAGETDGRDYHFVDEETFQGMITRNEFLEWARVHGHYYGTSRRGVAERLEEGLDVLLDVDTQGAERLIADHPEAHSIFVMPPSFDSLRQRLCGRGLDDAQEIQRRLAVSFWEIRRYHLYEYVIINEDAERASEVLASIVLEKRHRRSRMEGRVAPILDDFAQAAEPERGSPSPAQEL